jgi:hypothetical protein
LTIAWIEGSAVLLAVAIVAGVGSFVDWRKEIAFVNVRKKQMEGNVVSNFSKIIIVYLSISFIRLTFQIKSFLNLLCFTYLYLFANNFYQRLELDFALILFLIMFHQTFLRFTCFLWVHFLQVKLAVILNFDC